MTATAKARPRRGIARVVQAVVTAWALAGGLLLLAVVTLSVLSVLGTALLGRPLPGDFELVQMGVAVAVFAFLPYCQLIRANVTADVFTMRASPRALARMGLAAAAVALAVAVVLAWRMGAGLVDYRRYAETTTILQIPHWIAFVPILVSLVLLALAAGLGLCDDWAKARRTGGHRHP